MGKKQSLKPKVTIEVEPPLVKPEPPPKIEPPRDGLIIKMIPIDLPQDIIDKMNLRRYVKATAAEVLMFQKYPFGLPRSLSTPISLMEKTTGLIWTLVRLGGKSWEYRGNRKTASEMKPWVLERESEGEVVQMEILGDRHRLAEYFEAPELASCPELWRGCGI